VFAKGEVRPVYRFWNVTGSGGAREHLGSLAGPLKDVSMTSLPFQPALRQAFEKPREGLGVGAACETR